MRLVRRKKNLLCVDHRFGIIATYRWFFMAAGIDIYIYALLEMYIKY